MKRSTGLVVVGIVLVLAFVAAGALGVRADRAGNTPSSDPGPGDQATAAAAAGRDASLASSIEQLEARVESLPADDVSWANLGIAYVEQARVTADTSLYPRAEAALERSLEVNDADNFTAHYGLAALAGARHDFGLAEEHALTGLAINPKSSPLHGILSDAQIQQGRYDEGFASAQRSVDLAPGVASFARISYTYQLTGDVDQATALMQRALDDAGTGTDRAFALFHLGELALGEGDPDTALGYFLDALEADPDNIAALSGKAHALRVSGQTLTSIDAYEKLIDVAPTADFLVEFSDFLMAEGRDADAGDLLDRARTQLEADAANGARGDAGTIMFEADHGDPVKALRDAELAVAENPFVETHEAHAWALYVNGNYADAVVAVELAQQLGLRDAELYMRSAEIREAAGDPQGALDDLRFARAIDGHAAIPPALQMLAEPEVPT